MNSIFARINRFYVLAAKYFPEDGVVLHLGGGSMITRKLDRLRLQLTEGITAGSPDLRSHLNTATYSSYRRWMCPNGDMLDEVRSDLPEAA